MLTALPPAGAGGGACWEVEELEEAEEEEPPTAPPVVWFPLNTTLPSGVTEYAEGLPRGFLCFDLKHEKI